MNKNALKILSIFLILIIVLFNFSYADTPGKIIKGYFVDGSNNDSSFNPDALEKNIVDIFTFIGYGLAVCVVMITGIQFLTANAQKKAQLKEKLWLILIGVIILAGGTTIYATIREALMKLR